MKRYTKKGRLSDVIALISLLAVDSGAFRSNSNLTNALRGEPQSVKSRKWEEVAELHPEFFRFNGERTHIALLIRSYFPESNEGKRVALNVSETQKLIDTAIALHDKEIALRQRYAYLFPFLGSIVVAIFALIGSIYSTRHNIQVYKENELIRQRIDTLIKKIQDVDVSNLTGRGVDTSTKKIKDYHNTTRIK